MAPFLVTGWTYKWPQVLDYVAVRLFYLSVPIAFFELYRDAMPDTVYRPNDGCDLLDTIAPPCRRPTKALPISHCLKKVAASLLFFRTLSLCCQRSPVRGLAGGRLRQIASTAGLNSGSASLATSMHGALRPTFSLWWIQTSTQELLQSGLLQPVQSRHRTTHTGVPWADRPLPRDQDEIYA